MSVASCYTIHTDFINQSVSYVINFNCFPYIKVFIRSWSANTQWIILESVIIRHKITREIKIEKIKIKEEKTDKNIVQTYRMCCLTWKYLWRIKKKISMQELGCACPDFKPSKRNMSSMRTESMSDSFSFICHVWHMCCKYLLGKLISQPKTRKCTWPNKRHFIFF